MNRTHLTIAITLLAITPIGVRGKSGALAQQTDLARELPRIPPRDADEAVKSFRLQDGFRLVPVATEPLLTDPVSVCYDADGRLYAAEMRGYPYPEKSPTGNVRRLEDRDGDGRFDSSTIFVDGLSWPTSVLPYDGGVFIAVAPDILYAKDTNGDGVADVKRVRFTGFGTQNVQGLLNGLLWGPDGWIYGTSGSNGGEIRNEMRPGDPVVSVRGRDFRFKPDGSKFEAISGGGQFGHAFDDWGHRFTCNNSNHIRQIVLPSRYLERNRALVTSAVVDDIAEEGPAAPVFRLSPAEPWRVVRTRQRAADPAMVKRLPPTELVATGFFTSATGVTIYRGSRYPAQYRGNAFVGDVGGNLVHRKVLTKQGAEFRARRADENVEFLASSDNWFRPVNFADTPDGTLLVIDMYRETIEHPLSIPDPIKKHLDLTSGKDRGRLYDLVPAGGTAHRHPRLTKASTPELVAHLADPDAWWRETAQRLLLERHDLTAAPLLKELARSRPTALARLHALWTLDALGRLDAEEIVRGLTDPEPFVRERSAVLTEGRVAGSPILIDPLLALARDDDPMVRFQAAFSLGDVTDPRALSALAAIAAKDAGDRWTRAAVSSSIAGRTMQFVEALDEIRGVFDSPAGRGWLGRVALLVGAENSPNAVQAMLARFAKGGTHADPTLFRVVFLGLGRGLQRAGGSLRHVLRQNGSVALDPLFQDAAHTATDGATVDARIEAIRLLGLGPETKAFEVLPELLDARQPTAVQLSALQAIAAIDDKRVGPAVIAHWKALSPTVRREAVEALFARRERLSALADAIEAKTVVPSDLDPARRKQLLANADKTSHDRLVPLLSVDPHSDRGALIAQYRPSLGLKGDRGKGREVFKKTCATCHKAEGQGTDVGPNLATITGRTTEDLLVHILDPNREVPPNYLNYNVATTDGRIVSGVIADESANAVTLKRAEGVAEVIPRARIETIASTGLSLMPEGLEKGYAPQDMADLLAYLRSFQPDAAPAPR